MLQESFNNHNTNALMNIPKNLGKKYITDSQKFEDNFSGNTYLF